VLNCDRCSSSFFDSEGNMKRFRTYGRYALTLGATLIASASMRAQVATPGSRVRIIPIGTTTQTEGLLVASTRDSISVHPGLGGPLLSVPMDSVRAIDQSEGIHSSFGTVMKDGGIGAAIGVGAVAVVGTATCHISHDDLCGLQAVVGGILAGAAGFVTGILIGRSHKGETWKRVYERPQSTSLLIGPAARGGVAVGVSIAFGDGSETR
jgi:hypothetical protein